MVYLLQLMLTVVEIYHTESLCIDGHTDLNRVLFSYTDEGTSKITIMILSGQDQKALLCSLPQNAIDKPK
jgi:hypothetical protein